MDLSEAQLPTLPMADPKLAAEQAHISFTVMAWALVTAEFEGDKIAQARFEVTAEELKEWRRALYRRPKSNMELVREVRRIKDELQTTWTDQLAGAKLAVLNYITRAARSESYDAITISTMTKALGTVAEIEQTTRFIDAKLAELNGESPKARQGNREPVSEEDEGTPPGPAGDLPSVPEEVLESPG